MARPERGDGPLDGQPVAFAATATRSGAGIAYVSEDRLPLGLVQPQSIADNTVIAVLDRLLGPAG